MLRSIASIFFMAAVVTLSYGCRSTNTQQSQRVFDGYLKWSLHVIEKADRRGKMVAKASYAGWVAPLDSSWVLPVNTRVQARIRKRGLVPIEILVPDKGKTIFMEYNSRNMNGMSTEQFLQSLVAGDPLDLSKYKHADDIRAGRVKPGMTKEEVLLAWGIPPKNLTPDTAANRWVYWIDRWRKVIVIFEGDRVKSLNPPINR